MFHFEAAVTGSSVIDVAVGAAVAIVVDVPVVAIVDVAPAVVINVDAVAFAAIA